MNFFKRKEFHIGEVNVFDKMNIWFLNDLDELRALVGEPLTLTSTYRTPEHNKSIGGAPKSFHLLGKAADISCQDSRLRAKIVKEALWLGLTVGVSTNFIHVDNRRSQIMFTY